MEVTANPGFVEILRNDEHIKYIIQGEEWDIPTIDHTLWVPEVRQEKGKVLEYIVEFLSLPYYVDDFAGNHSERRKWRTNLSENPDFFEFYEQNALKWNRIYGAHCSLEVLKSGYQGKNQKQFELHIDDANKQTTGYNLLPTWNRIEHVRSFKEQVYKILEVLSQDEQSSYTSPIIEGIKSVWKTYWSSNAGCDETLKEVCGHKVLIADDSNAAREILNHNFKKCLTSITVDEAKDSAELQEKALANQYDLIITDINMPGRSTLEVIKKIREGDKETPVITVSAEDNYESSKYGVNEHYTKNARCVERLCHEVSDYFSMQDRSKKALSFEEFKARGSRNVHNYNNFIMHFTSNTADPFALANQDSEHYRIFQNSCPELEVNLKEAIAGIDFYKSDLNEQLKLHEKKLYEAYRFMRIFVNSDNVLFE